MKKIAISSWFIAASTIFTLTACSFLDDPVTDPVKPVIPEGKNYLERQVPVMDPHGVPQGAVVLRYFDDMPNVPYVSISSFHSIMYPGTTLLWTKTADNKYMLASPCGTAMVDTANDIFESDDYEAFTNMMWMIQPGMPNTTYDGLPLIRWKSLEMTPHTVHVALDYGKFGINLRADDDGVYFPFATIADLYADGYMHTAAFNGQTVMVSPDGSPSINNGYPRFFTAPILKETRPADMADYTYKNICFTMTKLYGHPGRSLLEKKGGLKEKGLDQALQDYGKAGQMTRQALMSESMYEYITGIYMLGFLLQEGHTDFILTDWNDIKYNIDYVNSINAIFSPLISEFYSCCPEYDEFYKFGRYMNNCRDSLMKIRQEKMGEGVKYYKEGATAYCFFDSFDDDASCWRKFYKGEGPRPTTEDYPDSELAAFIDALEKAENDQDVKNFVLDISANGGGSQDIPFFITSILCNKADFYYDNSLTEQHFKCSYDVDRNLDGKFDEKDAEVKYHLNFALLTSPFTWSASNLLAALLKDYGIPLIGKRSSGGSCCVIVNPWANGFAYRYSTHRAKMTTTHGGNIEDGIAPTYELEIDDYYNIPKVTQLIESYYAK